MAAIAFQELSRRDSRYWLFQCDDSELCAQGFICDIFPQDVECHVSQDGGVLLSIVLEGSVTAVVHLDIEAPVQAVFRAPMSPGGGIEADVPKFFLLSSPKVGGGIGLR